MQSIIQFMNERFGIFRAIFFHCWLWCVCIPVLVLTHFLTGKTKPRFGETERTQEFPASTMAAASEVRISRQGMVYGGSL